MKSSEKDLDHFFILPRKVPRKKTPKGTLMTGEVMLMNQLGRKGVILKKMM